MSKNPGFSDVELLAGWGRALREYTERCVPVSTCDWMVFRPGELENSALMRLGESHPVAIQQVQSFLDYAEEQYQAFLRGEEEAKENFFQAMVDLAGRIEAAVGIAATADNKTDNRKKLVPDDPAVMQLAQKIKADLPKGGTKTDIALDFTEGNAQEAERLLRQLRRYPHLLQ